MIFTHKNHQNRNFVAQIEFYDQNNVEIVKIGKINANLENQVKKCLWLSENQNFIGFKAGKRTNARFVPKIVNF